MEFKFKATTAEGRETNGVRDAVDRFALARAMRVEGLTLISAEPTRRQGGFWTRLLGGVNFITLKDQVLLVGALAAMLNAGLSLSRALSVLERQVSRRALKRIVGELGERVSRGESLSRAFAVFPEAFPPVVTAMTAAGEESGNLSGSLEIVRQQLAKSYDLRRKTRGAMIYPVIIIVAIIVVAILMLVFLIPNLTSLFAELDVELPLSTRVVIAVSGFLNHYLLWVLLALGLLLLGFWRWRKSRSGRRTLSAVFRRLPAIGTIVKNYNAAITLRTLASLISAGVSMVDALMITAKVLQNPHYQEVLEAGAKQVQTGTVLSKLFRGREDLYPLAVAEMAEVGEETGNLSGMLLKGAVFFEEEVDQATKNLSTIIEPVLMVLIGAAVGFFAVSMIGPIYSLTQAL